MWEHYSRNGPENRLILFLMMHSLFVSSNYRPRVVDTQTPNLDHRIDSLIVAFVSACQKTINNGKIKTYESGRYATGTLKSAS